MSPPFHTGKPKIRKVRNRWRCAWEIVSLEIFGFGDTPVEAYSNWRRSMYYRPLPEKLNDNDRHRMRLMDEISRRLA